jgi:hypothetical protein
VAGECTVLLCCATLVIAYNSTYAQGTKQKKLSVVLLCPVSYMPVTSRVRMENWLQGQSFYSVMAITEQNSIEEVQVPWRFRHECGRWKAWKNNIMYTVMYWAQKFQNTGSVCDHCESRRI